MKKLKLKLNDLKKALTRDEMKKVNAGSGLCVITCSDGFSAPVQYFLPGCYPEYEDFCESGGQNFVSCVC